MNRTSLIILLLATHLSVYSNHRYERAKVDERIELMSTVFRLAQAQEYSLSQFTIYVNKVDSHFGPYKNHALIAYTKVLRRDFAIGFDAVADLALFLKIDNKKISLRDDIALKELDDRWPHDSIPKYIRLLNDFYRTTSFFDFYQDNAPIRKIAEENFYRNIVDDFDFAWFERFFRTKQTSNFQIIISLLNGSSSYGPRIYTQNGDAEYYAIMGTASFGSDGYPNYHDSDIPNTLVHEFSHAVCDTIVGRHREAFFPQTTLFYMLSQETLELMAYGEPSYYLNELFVRALTMVYNSSHQSEHYIEQAFLAREISLGFLWLPQLYEALKRYENDRTYASLDDYMPEIIKIHNALVPQELFDKLQNDLPKVVKTSVADGNTTVDARTDSIIVCFDKPMLPDSGGELYCDAQAPDYTQRSRWLSAFEYVVYVKLEPKSSYAIEFPHFFFKSTDYYEPKESYCLRFQTR